MLIKACFLFLYGSCLASFACCLAQRFVSKTSILMPPSFCDFCQRRLKFWQLIPILGYLLQKGHCHFCKHKISSQSTFLEIFGGLCLILLGSKLTFIHWPLLFSLFFWCLALSLQDYYTQSVASLLLFLGGAFILLCNFKNCYFIFLAHWQLLVPFNLLLVLLSYTNKLGSADVVFIIVISLLIGFFYTLYLLLISCVLAVLYCLVTHAKKLAFIPFLSISLLIILLYLRFFK